MLKISFSTVATPEWTLDRVARAASEYGYDGVELRTFGNNSSEFACDPALTSGEKVRRLFRDHGVAISCVATGVRFDEPVRPALIGRVFGDPDRSVRLAKAAIDLATQIECPFVRVFGFEMAENERYASGMARIVDRLSLVADAARNTGVRVLLENGGTFTTAEELVHVLDRVGNPLLGAAYSVAVGAAEEDVLSGIATLGDRLMSVKMRDFSRGADGTSVACVLGEGVVPCERVVRELSRSGYTGWACVEWDRAWLAGLASAESVLPEAARRVFAWMGSGKPKTVLAGSR
jgi:sugar phosphate isomerase/epimerase